MGTTVVRASSHFDVPDVRCALPFLVHNVHTGGSVKFPWTKVWRHALFMGDRLVILTAQLPPTTMELLAQLEEARRGQMLEERDVYAVIPYAEVRRVALHGARGRARLARLVLDVRHWPASTWEVDFVNQLILDFTDDWSHPYDPAKLTRAREDVPRALPSTVRLRGF